MTVIWMGNMLYCAGEKRERRLKQATAADEDEDDDNSDVELSDPMIGFTFNKCKLLPFCVILKSRSIHLLLLFCHSYSTVFFLILC